jgi:hypothetical protein
LADVLTVFVAMKMIILYLKTPTIKREAAIGGGKMFYFRKRISIFGLKTAIFDVTNPIMGVKMNILKPENRKIRRCKANFGFIMVIMKAKTPIMKAKMVIMKAMKAIMDS